MSIKYKYMPLLKNPFGGTASSAMHKQNLDDDFAAIQKKSTQKVSTPQAAATQSSASQDSAAKAEEPRPIISKPSPYQSELGKFYAGLNFSEPDESAITLQEQQRMQLNSQIDAIHTLYNDEIARQGEIFNDLQGQRRALSSRGGRLSSPIDQGQTQKIDQKQKDVVTALNAQRNLEIASLKDKVSQRVIDRVKAEKEQALNNREAYLNFLKGQQEESREDIINFAKSGGSLEDLAREDLENILEQTGMSEFALKSTFALNNPMSKADFTIQGNKAYGTYYNPSKGQFEVFTQDVDLPTSTSSMDVSPFQADDGTIFLMPKQFDPTKSFDEQIIMVGDQSQFAKPEDSTEEERKTSSIIEYEYAKANGYEGTYNDFVTSDEEVEDTSVTNSETEATRTVLESKLNLIDEILNSDGLSGSVGTFGINRWTPFSPDKAQRKDFFASVQQLISQETLDKLVNLKAQGGTLGALSEKELEMLRGASTKINSWIMKDKHGNPTGKLEISEDLFKKELDKIKDATKGMIDKLSSGDDIDSFLDNIGGVSGFNSDLSMSLNDLPEAQGIFNQDKVITSLGQGTVTGIKGSKYWKHGLDFYLGEGKGEPVTLPFGAKVKKVVANYSNPKNKPLAKSTGKSQNSGFGNQVIVELPDGSELAFSHLDDVAGLKEGVYVPAGTYIGNQGNTGLTYGNTGVHLDITMKKPDGSYYTPKQVASLFNTTLV